MKKLYIALVVVAAAAASSLIWDCGDCDKSTYQPRGEEAQADGIQGYFEYLNDLKKNPATGRVDKSDVENALSQIESMKNLGKASFPLQWETAGPTNFGGRTRSFVVDNSDNRTLYVGGVNGGVWKSTNKGASWSPISDEISSLSVGSMCQTPNGDIYAGTGEGFTSLAGGETYTPGFPGDGIFLSTDGETFTKLTTSQIFTYVYRLVSHPTDNTVFAATNIGLYYSSDQGVRWNRIKAGACTDFAIASDGSAIAVFANRVYRATSATTESSYTLATGVPVGARVVVAMAPSDPKFVYAQVTGSVTIETPSGNVSVGDGLVGVYQSKDNGSSFERIVGKENTYFNLMTHLSLESGQGIYNSCISVHPENPEWIFMGGIEFASWTPEGGPRIVGNTFDSPTNPAGIHPDKHFITWDTESDPPIMYITHDGGITKSTNAAMDRFATITNGYQTTQFFGIDVGPDGSILGGTQDQRTILIDLNGSRPTDGEFVWPGDGGRVEISDLNPDIIFAQNPRAFLFRSLNKGGGWSSFWDLRINEEFVDPDDPDSDTDPYVPGNNFNSALRLWENLETGENRFFLGLNNSLWMAYDVVNQPSPVWYKIGNVGGVADQIEVTKDGNTVYVGNNSRLYRFEGLNDVTWDTTGELAAPLAIPSQITRTRIDDGFPNAEMTDLEIDNSDEKRVAVTFGSYGVSNHVFITEDVTAASPVFRNIDGALPNMPIFDIEISWENPDHMILGTEFGIWATENGSATTPLWTKQSDGFPNTAVFEMVQTEIQRENWRTGPTLYAGTHGRGIFKSYNLLTSAKEVAKASTTLNVYPNPAVGKVNIDFTAEQSDAVEISLYDMQGKRMLGVTKDIYSAGAQSVKFDMSTVPAGVYFVKLKGAHHEGSYRVVKSN